MNISEWLYSVFGHAVSSYLTTYIPVCSHTHTPLVDTVVNMHSPLLVMEVVMLAHTLVRFCVSALNH